MDLCRTCLSTENLTTIKNDFVTIIERLLPIKIEETSNFICTNCRACISLFNEFRDQCLKCDRIYSKKHHDSQESNDKDFFNNVDPKNEIVQRHIPKQTEDKRQKRIAEYNRKMLTKEINPKFKRNIDLIDKYPCTECSEIFAEKITLNRHFKVMHPESKPLTKCMHCDMTFYYSESLMHHVIKTHMKNKDTFKCTQCNKCTRSKYALESHMKVVHSRQHPIKCSKCDAVLKHMYSYRNHMKIHQLDANERRIVCNICGIKVLNIKGHVNTVHTKKEEFQKKLRCRMCNEPKYFDNLAALRQHRNNEHEHELRDKPYNIACAQCNRMFTNKNNLKSHIRYFHTAERTYPCSVCDKKFKTQSNVRTHMRFHSDYRPFACVHCDKRFRSTFKLTNHERVHTGEKPFACDCCGKMFAQKTNLKTHMRVHLKENLQ